MDDAIATVEPAEFEVVETGLVIHGEPDYDLWASAVAQAQRWNTALQWVIGALVNYGESRFGELAAQAIDSAGWSEETIRVFAWVERQVPPENRIPEPRLTYGHHQVVASLPADQQRAWLEQAETGGGTGLRWSTNQLRAELDRARARPVTLWLTVSCRDAADLEGLADRLRAEGRKIRGGG